MVRSVYRGNMHRRASESRSSPAIVLDSVGTYGQKNNILGSW